MYTEFILNYIFAWLAVLLGIFLLAKHFLRSAVKKTSGEKKGKLVSINKSIKTHHIIAGFLLIILALIHGLYSSDEIWSLNIGTINWILGIGAGITWLARGRLKSGWLQLHKALAISFVIFLGWHIIDVGGIHVFRIMNEMKSESTFEAAIEIDSSVETGNDMSNENKDNDNKDAKTNTGLENEPLKKQGNTDNPDISNPINSTNPNAGGINNQKQTDLPYFFSFAGLEMADDTYQVEETGYRPNLKLEVLIEDNMVKRIKIVSHKEIDSRYYQEPMEKIPVEILKKQSLLVDAVAGATQTSAGLVKGVRKAVLEAMDKKENNP